MKANQPPMGPAKGADFNLEFRELCRRYDISIIAAWIPFMEDGSYVGGGFVGSRGACAVIQDALQTHLGIPMDSQIISNIPGTGCGGGEERS